MQFTAGTYDVIVIGAGHAGVEAALAGHMRVLGVGSAARNPKATFSASDLAHANWADILD